ncbi:hypothetical protein PsorP6_014866 [Peronosclerospora sorghi]|uniref:Uncharacterized protein n=1 Tax=Peronosclerospora sorghi TaxID=230839 RepID=A0ACC0VRB0_9STRA|nr:hypothetical protein PsorP6_014866 [Peronosclerospora sorghi]
MCHGVSYTGATFLRRVPNSVAAQVSFLPFRAKMKMQSFAECNEQKERVKACYGDWFHRLWSGHFEQANCEQETQDFRECVQDAMQRRKEEARRKANDEEDSWMDRTKQEADEMASSAKSRARHARERAHHEKEKAKDKAQSGVSDVKDKVKGSASDVANKVQETADSWADKIKGLAK